MKLETSQREKLLEWVAEGLRTDEINQRAAQFAPPFSVSRQLVDKYRQRTGLKINKIKDEADMTALTKGLALRHNRVAKLQELAEKLGKDIFGPNLWVTDVKSVGNMAVDVEKFNSAEVDQYRGVLDDIAKEVGDRKTKTENENTTTLVMPGLLELIAKVYGNNSRNPGA